MGLFIVLASPVTQRETARGGRQLREPSVSNVAGVSTTQDKALVLPTTRDAAVETDMQAPVLPRESKPRLTVDEVTIGESIEGRPMSKFRIGEGEYVVLLMASIHGSEAAGTPLLTRLMEHLQENPALADEATIVLIPLVNPDGVAKRSRLNARGVDLNRNFPAENRENSKRYGMEALSEPEAVAIYRTIEDELPNHIITLHEPLQCVDYDGPGEELAKVMSAVCPLPVKKLGSRPGSLGSYAGVTLGIPTITLELPKNAATQSPELLWQFYGNALVEAVRHREP